MAKSIKHLKETPVKDLLKEIWDSEAFKHAVIDENLSGASGLTYMLAWKICEQQKQIDKLTEGLNHVNRYVSNNHKGIS